MQSKRALFGKETSERKMIKNKRGQIWVETVIYILIALIMIGAVLAFVNPKIRQIQDKLTLDKTVELLDELNSKITEVAAGTANKRIVNIEIKKGELKIEPDKIIYTLDESRVAYSEPVAESDNTFVSTGKLVQVRTVKKGDVYTVQLKIEPSDVKLIYPGSALTKSSSSYKLALTNTGNNEINIELIS